MSDNDWKFVVCHQEHFAHLLRSPGSHFNLKAQRVFNITPLVAFVVLFMYDVDGFSGMNSGETFKYPNFGAPFEMKNNLFTILLRRC